MLRLLFITKGMEAFFFPLNLLGHSSDLDTQRICLTCEGGNDLSVRLVGDRRRQGGAQATYIWNIISDFGIDLIVLLRLKSLRLWAQEERLSRSGMYSCRGMESPLLLTEGSLEHRVVSQNIEDWSMESSPWVE